MGMTITGSDMRESPAVDHLRALGIPIAIGQRAENVAGAELVIRTAAAHDSNPEIAEARRLGLPVYERGPGLGVHHARLPQRPVHRRNPRQDHHHLHVHPHRHGRRRRPHRDDRRHPPSPGGGPPVGHGDTIILESCEYCNSFLHFYPTIAVI